MRNPLPDIVTAQLAADPVQRTGFAALAGDRVAHLTLLRGVDVLAFLDLRGILCCRRACATDGQHNRKERSHQASSPGSRRAQQPHQRYLSPTLNEWAV